MLARGTRIDRYVVDHLLGQGGMADVYAAHHAMLGTRHALKVLHTRSAAARERLVREGQVQARMDPRHVVPVTDIVEVDGSPALVMPLVDGRSLRDLLRAHRPAPDAAVALFAGIVAGVATAHDAGVVHRDLKPANVLLEVRYGAVSVRVADFGLAKGLAGAPADTRVGSFLGTPAYAAPEQLDDATGVDHRADLWSLGVILYELLCGEPPFGFAGPRAVRDRIAAGVDTSAVPVRWRALVASLLRVAPGDRPGSAHDVAAAVATDAPSLLAADTVLARALAPPEPREATLAPSAPSTALPVSEVGAVLHTLPAERDAFVGRADGLARVAEAVAAAGGLVSVVGAGGVGKTRLVVHHAWRHLADWPGGVWFCDLADARDVHGIVRAVAAGLGGVDGGDDPVERLGQAIAGRGRCLVILDNFEQVARHAVRTAGRWAAAAPEAAFLVTTREVLGLPGERVLPVGPLDPADAVALFEDRARAAHPGFAPTDADRTAVAALVDLLDQLPLAIELAAARARVLRPGQLLDRMRDRFKLLISRGGRRDRQATLRASIDWSWRLLARWEQAALAQLAVFEGGCDLDAAEAVIDLEAFPDAPWAIDAVQSLVDKSLLRCVGEGRFAMLVAVHEYAGARLRELGGQDAARERHGRHFARFGTEAALAALHGPGGAARHRALPVESANLVAACRRAVARGDVDVAVATARAAWVALQKTGPMAVAAELLGEVLAMDGLGRRARGALLVTAGRVHDRLGDAAAGGALYDEAMAADPGSAAAERAATLRGRQLTEREPERARAMLDQSAAAHAARGDRRWWATARNAQAGVLWRLGDLPAAISAADEALATAREVGDRALEARILASRSTLHRFVGEPARQHAGLREALAIHGELHNRADQAYVGAGLGLALHLDGQSAEGRAVLAEAIRVARTSGYARAEAYSLSNLASIDRAEGRLEDAVARLGRAAALMDRQGDVSSQSAAVANRAAVLAHLGRLAEARAGYLDWLARFDSPDRVTTLADLALTEVRLGHHDDATARAEEALTLNARLPDAPWFRYVQVVAAGVHRTCGDPERGAALLARAEAGLTAADAPAIHLFVACERAERALAAGDAEAARAHVAAAAATNPSGTDSWSMVRLTEVQRRLALLGDAPS